MGNDYEHFRHLYPCMTHEEVKRAVEATHRMLGHRLYGELSEDLQDKVREEYREDYEPDNSEYDDVEEDCIRAGKVLGITIEEKRCLLRQPCIYWQDLGCQGNAAFEGSYSYAKGSYATMKRDYPCEWDLHRIAKDLMELQKKCWYGLRATVETTGDTNLLVDVEHNYDKEVTHCQYSNLKELMKDFASWIYDSLEKQYEYLTSCERADEELHEVGRWYDTDGSEIDFDLMQYRQKLQEETEEN